MSNGSLCSVQCSAGRCAVLRAVQCWRGGRGGGGYNVAHSSTMMCNDVRSELIVYALHSPRHGSHIFDRHTDTQTRLYPHIPLYQCTDLAHYAPPTPTRSSKTPPPGGLAGAPHRLGTHSKATRDVVIILGYFFFVFFWQSRLAVAKGGVRPALNVTKSLKRWRL